MSTYDPGDDFDALLRDSMRNEAETVMPAGDGLSRIQQRVTARRARMRWMRPALALGSVAVLAIAGVGAYAVMHGNGENALVPQPPATRLPSQTPTIEPTPSQTPPGPAGVAFPKRAIFPFTSAKDERAWEQQAAQGHSPWEGDPRSVATLWVANFLQLPSVNQVIRQTSTPTKVDVTLGRMQSDGSSKRQVSVTTVHLVKYGKAWLVTGATEDSGLLQISSPKAGTTVSSPLVASGPGGGVHRAADVQVRDATTPTKYGEGHDGSFGSTQGWSATVPFSTPSGAVGVVLVVEYSDADGLPLRVTAEQVRFGSSSISAGPQYFYGIKGGRVTKFAARNGAGIDYLTDPQPGGGASDPQLVGDYVYFLRANGTCSVALHRVSTATSDNTQPELTVATADNGYAITGYAATSPQRYTYYEQACDSSRSPQAKLVFIDTGGTKRSIDFQGQPPMLVADPSYEPTNGGRAYVDAIIRTGNASYLARFDEFASTSPTPSRNACPGYDTSNGRPWALETDASGVIWFATQTGSSMQVWKCAAGTSTASVAFTVPGNRQPKDVDVSSTGSVLLTDTNGDVWRWDGSGDATELTSHQEPLFDVTW